MRAILVVLAIMLAASWCEAQDGRAWRVRLEGDLDSARVAHEFRGQLVEAEKAGAGAIILELEGRKARWDVVWMIGQALRGSSVPVTSYVPKPARGSVGAGHFTIALLASKVYIHPDATIVWEDGDDLWRLAPDDANWEQVHRQVSGAVYQALRERGAEPRLADVLIGPGVDTWVVLESGGRAEVMTAQPSHTPEDGFVKQVVFGVQGGSGRVEIPSRVVLGGYGAHSAATGTIAARAEGLTLSVRRPIVVKSGLASAEREVRTMLDAYERELARAQVYVDEAAAAAARAGNQARREQVAAAGRALDVISGVESAIRRGEARVEEFPEILRLVPPGRSSLMDASSARRRSAWESEFNRAWTRVRTARTAAEGYAR